MSRQATINKTIGFCFLSIFFTNAVIASENKLEEFGDIMQFALPLTAWGSTFIYGDKEGRMQFYKHGATALTIGTLGKGIFKKTRPNASSSKTSFPSGHTNGAFIGATFLNTRYGMWWGIPAYTAAVVTAYSRVDADAHNVDDVIAGASLAFFSNLFWVSPYDSNITITPTASGDSTGISLTVTDKKPKLRSRSIDGAPKYRFSLGFGPAYMAQNSFTAPFQGGTPFDLADFEGTTNPQTTAVPAISWFLGDQHTLALSLSPYEARDFGRFSETVNFNGTVFPANIEIRSAYRMTEVRVAYDYDFAKVASFEFRVGASLIYTRTVLELYTTEGPALLEKIDDKMWLPLLNLGLDYEISRKWSFAADVSAISLSEDKQVDGSLLFSYQFDQHWDGAFGYTFYSRDIETSTLANRARYDILTLVAGYSFF
ncbi:MAG: phosphatase PAP2 family protein [Thiohalomonadales bacterium]